MLPELQRGLFMTPICINCGTIPILGDAAKSTPGVDADKVIQRIKRTLAEDRGIARACAQVMATGDASAVSALISLRKDIDLIAGRSGPTNEAIVNALNDGACFTRFWNGQEYFPRLDIKKACGVLAKLRSVKREADQEQIGGATS